MQRPSTFVPARPRVKRPQNARGATDFLRADAKLAALLPAAERFARLQGDCAAALPAMFDNVHVMGFEQGQLVLGVPNAALAARLKQQLPKLQESLLKRAWQVTAIRLKVQVRPLELDEPQPKQAKMPKAGAAAFAALEKSLEKTKGNAALIDAVASLVKRYQDRKP